MYGSPGPGNSYHNTNEENKNVDYHSCDAQLAFESLQVEERWQDEAQHHADAATHQRQEVCKIRDEQGHERYHQHSCPAYPDGITGAAEAAFNDLIDRVHHEGKCEEEVDC